MSIQNDLDALAADIKRLVAEFNHKSGARCSVDVQWLDMSTYSSEQSEYHPVVSVSAFIDSKLA